MKRQIAFLLAVVLLFSAISTYALNIGDPVGEAYNTDIVAYINGYAIPSYAANGTSVIVAEHLINFGFDVLWDELTRTLSITRNEKTKPYGMYFTKSNSKPGEKYTDLFYTDIKVYADGIEIKSYAANGVTMIPIEGLYMFGNVLWSEEWRSITLTVPNLEQREEEQIIDRYRDENAPSLVRNESKALYAAPAIIYHDTVIGNVKTKTFHTVNCNKLPAHKNRVYFNNRAEAMASGYNPCSICEP